MNILYLDHYAGSPAMGMEYRPYYLAREWQHLGHRVAIVAASHAHVRTIQPVITKSITYSQVEGLLFIWIKTPSYFNNGFARILNILAYLRGLRRWKSWLPFRPDIIVASSTYPMDVGPARTMAKLTGAKLIWEVHDLWPLSPMELGGMPWWHPFILWVQHYETIACRHSDAVVSLLPLAHLHLTTRGMPRARFHYIPNGVDIDSGTTPSILPPPIAEVISTANSAGRFIVTYTGAHGPANALDALIDCAISFSDASILILLIGSGPEKPRLIRRANGHANIQFFDPVPKGSINAILRSVDAAFISLQSQPLFRFGISPNKLMDYMLAGVPVINAIAAGNDPVTESGCGLTIPPDSPDAIIAAIKAIRQMTPEQRKTMGNRGREYILRRQTYPVLARRFFDIMLNLTPTLAGKKH